MLTKIRLLLSFLALCVAIPALAQYDGDETQATNWWEESPWSNPDRGFNWYPDPATVAPPPKPKAPPPPQAAKPPKKLNEIDNIKDLGKDHDKTEGGQVNVSASYGYEDGSTTQGASARAIILMEFFYTIAKYS